MNMNENDENFAELLTKFKTLYKKANDRQKEKIIINFESHIDYLDILIKLSESK